jgi:hypothetical protein
MQSDPNILAFEIGSAKLKLLSDCRFQGIFALPIDHFEGLFQWLEARCLTLDGGDWRGCDCIAMDLALRPSLWVASFCAGGFFMLNF